MIFLLALPSGVFASQAGSQQSYQGYSISSISSGVNTVVSPAASESVKVISSTQSFAMIKVQSNSSGCLVNGKNYGGFVQSPGILDLNQPAQCFSLNRVGGSVSSAVLSVKPLIAAMQTVKVIVVGFLLTGPSILPQAASQSVPILPAVFVYISALLVWEQKKVLIYRLISPTVKLKTALSLQQLQVFRC